MGGTGNVGRSVAMQLLKEGEQIIILGHNQQKAKYWKEQGAIFNAIDILDTQALHQYFSDASRLFILNPPADPSKDAEALERRQIKSILMALDGLNPEKIVMASTYGARDGDKIFDLGTCYELEQGLKSLNKPLAIIRSAYYMTNLDLPIKMAIESGKLSSLFPKDFKLPMVSPQDIGILAASLLQDERTGTFYIQADAEYSAADAAKVLTSLINKEVSVNEIQEKDWAKYMEDGGFSKASTESFVGMTKLTLEEKYTAPHPTFGATKLRAHLHALVQEEH